MRSGLIICFIVSLAVTPLFGEWIAEVVDPETGLRSGTVRQGEITYDIGPDAVLFFADLEGLDLSEADLSGAELTLAGLTGANLSGANLSGANLGTARAEGVNLTEASLVGAILRNAIFQDAVFTGANLEGANIEGAAFSGANLDQVRGGSIQGIPFGLPAEWAVARGYLIGPRADLQFADLTNIDLSDLDLTGINLTNANLTGANLTNANLRSSRCEGAMFLGADLQGANLERSWLKGARFFNSNLSTANLRYADLREVDLTGTNRAGAVFWMADMRGIRENGDVVSFSGEGITSYDNGWMIRLIGRNYDDIELVKAWGGGQQNSRRIESNSEQIDEVKTMMEAMSIQLQQLNTRVGDLQVSLDEKDAQIAELSQRPTLEEVQDARIGALMFTANQEANSVTLEFDLQVSEDLENWSSLPDTISAALPLDVGKKFVRISLAQD